MEERKWDRPDIWGSGVHEGFSLREVPQGYQDITNIWGKTLSFIIKLYSYK